MQPRQPPAPLPRVMVVAGSACLIAMFLSYYIGLFSYYRIFYLVTLLVFALALITPFYQRSMTWSAAGGLLAVTGLYVYFGLTALWSLYPIYTLQMVGVECLHLVILAIAIFWSSNASSRDIANLFRWLPRIVFLVYLYMLFRYGMVRGANSAESRAIAAISSGGAMAASMTIPFIMAAAMRYSRLAMVDLLIALVVLVLSASRTGYLLGVLMLFASIAAYADLRRKTIMRFAGIVGLLLVACGLSLTLPAVREAISAVFDRILLIAVIQENPAEAAQEVERITMYLVSWNAFLEHPLLGIGYQSLMPLTIAQYGYGSSSHNLLITLVVEAGWPAFFIFLWIIWAYFSRLKKLRDWASETDRAVLNAMRLSMIGLLIGSMFHQLIASHLFYVLLGAAFGLNVRHLDALQSSTRSRSEWPNERRTVPAV